MKKICLIFCLLPLAAFAETDAQISLNQAIESARLNCSGISVRMDKIKKMAGIGTVVNAVGTATGVGGVAAGAVKYNADVKTVYAMVEKEAVDQLLEKLKGGQKEQIKLAKDLKISPNLEKNLRALVDKVNAQKEQSKKEQVAKEHSAELQKEIVENQKKSTTAGNVRTGMFAVDTVSNIAGAITSSQTVADDDFIEQIKKCTDAIDALRTARSRSKFEDGDNANVQKMDLSEKIIKKCAEYEYVNLTPLNNLAKGAMAANSVGAATGTVATITSALGNNKKVSNLNLHSEDGANTLNKNLKMNIASNVMGGVTAAASLTGTVLNASQIKTAKQVLNIAQECEEALTW